MHVSCSQLLPTYFTEPLLRTSQIWKQEVVFEPGEHIQVIAPSGSGKTSFIHFLYGMRNLYHGEISYDGKSLKQTNIEEMAALRAGKLSVVFQDLRIFPHQTVRENLEIKRQLNPYHPDNPIESFCQRLGIGAKLDQLAGNCSYGEQQRMVIIRALLQPFELLLLDEPFSHLDRANSLLALQLIQEEVQKREATMILADLDAIDYFKHDRSLDL